MPSSSERILVMGVGNPLMRDEGIGPRVVEMLLTQFEFPDNVEVVDAGTMSYMILDMLREVDRLVIVDAIKDTEHPAGTVMLLTPEELAANQVMHSMHDLRVVNVLEAAALVGTAPETVVVGVQIDTIEEWVLDLSEPATEALPIACACVLDQLRDRGVVPTPRTGESIDARIIEALRSYAPLPEEGISPPAADAADTTGDLDGSDAEQTT